MIIEKWKTKDGAAWFSLSKAFIEVCKADQKLLFSMMSEELEVYNDWLSSLQYSYFTWHPDSPSPLEERRKRLIKVLEEGDTLSDNAEKLRENLIEKLKVIVPRVID